MQVTKTNRIKALLNENGALTPKQVARHVECDISLVYMVMRDMAKRNKVGRPRKATVTPSVNLVDASKTMLNLTKRLKDVSIAFDHENDKINLMWFDESYYVDVDELPKFVASMEYIQSREYKYEGDSHDNA